MPFFPLFFFPSDPVFPQPFCPVIAPCLVTTSAVETAIPISPDLKFRIHPRNVDLNSFLGLEMFFFFYLLRCIVIRIPTTRCFTPALEVQPVWVKIVYLHTHLLDNTYCGNVPI